MTLHRLLLISTMLALTACGSNSMRPKYSGHEESTKNVPGFDENGKKLSGNVKLGQSYTVDGETYVPRYQPGYVEEGMASWYGPGFHGGKTANGERYDQHEMTAAHRTLPLPSMVKVTFLKTGKSAIVRVNDRGPYAHGRIIDLSKASADAVGMTRYGTGKVRVEYLEQETRRFTSLMADGRNPKDIDVEDEVLAYVEKQQQLQQLAASPTVVNPETDATNVVPGGSPFELAAAQSNSASAAANDSSWWSHLNPIASAQAAPATATANADGVAADDLPPATLPAPAPAAAAVVVTPASPEVVAPAAPSITILPKGAGPAPVAKPHVQATTQPPAFSGRNFVQLGAFSKFENAQAMVEKVKDMGVATITPNVMENGETIYRVRLGPYPDADNLAKALAKLGERGLDAKPIYE